MTPKRIFISHASADEHVVPLLNKLLKVHGDDPWFAKRDVAGGSMFPSVIQDELERADALIVVVSLRTVQSTWVASEIARFRTLKPEGLIVPLVLDDFPKEKLGNICPELSGLQAVACRPGLLEGFRDLFAVLGRDFLSKRELRNRRQGPDRRRERKDRRASNAHQRLSAGLLITYTRETGNNLAAATHLTVTDLDVLRPTVLRELSRYGFHDVHKRIDVSPELVLDAAFHHVRTNLIRYGTLDAVQALRQAAAYIGESYEVRMLERRQGTRRLDRISA
jgi:hypothetical protein